MGLNERRRVKSLKDEIVPRYQAEMAESIGFVIPWEVDFSTMENHQSHMMYIENYVFDNIRSAFDGICRDDLGKEAAQAVIKGIHVARDPVAVDNRAEQVKLVDGIAQIRYYWDENEDQFSHYPGSEEIQRVLEAQL